MGVEYYFVSDKGKVAVLVARNLSPFGSLAGLPSAALKQEIEAELEDYLKEVEKAKDCEHAADILERDFKEGISIKDLGLLANCIQAATYITDNLVFAEFKALLYVRVLLAVFPDGKIVADFYDESKTYRVIDCYYEDCKPEGGGEDGEG